MDRRSQWWWLYFLRLPRPLCALSIRLLSVKVGKFWSLLGTVKVNEPPLSTGFSFDPEKKVWFVGSGGTQRIARGLFFLLVVPLFIVNVKHVGCDRWSKVELRKRLGFFRLIGFVPRFRLLLTNFIDLDLPRISSIQRTTCGKRGDRSKSSLCLPFPTHRTDSIHKSRLCIHCDIQLPSLSSLKQWLKRLHKTKHTP